MTATTLRTAHSSYVNLDPAEYDYVGAFDSDPEPGSFHGERTEWSLFGITVEANNPVHAEYLAGRRLLADSKTSRYIDDMQCDHCGARMRYVIVMLHVPTGDHIAIGETCHAERFDFDDKVTKDRDRLVKRAAAARATRRTLAKLDAWVAADERNAAAKFLLDTAHADNTLDGFGSSLRSALYRYGNLTDRQRDALHTSIERNIERAKADAEREVEVKVAVPDTDKRITIEGVVVSRKFQDNDFGGRMVITVKVTTDDGVWLAWGSEPSSIDTEVGDTVRFDAKVERSDRDETFGFFKRPTKATIVAG